jgi:RNA polymerase sigma factor (sigma-70 family)
MENLSVFSWRGQIQHMAIPAFPQYHIYIQRKTNKIVYTDTAKYEEQLTATSANDEKERLYKAIRTLSETERAIVSLHLDGYDNKEVSELLGITANLVGVRLHRAKQQLTTLLKHI